MGLRPRTARRLALVASLLFLLVGGAAAFYTIPKLQKSRQLSGFQKEGLEAHEAGRHNEAVTKLGRYLRAMRDRPVDPEIRLAFARSWAAWEVGDGGHLLAAIAVYREHLREHPDDRAASGELLELFIRTGAWTEARDLSVRLRPAEIDSAGAEDLAVLRHEARARVELNAADPLIVQIEDRLLAADRPTFEDAWRAFLRSERAGDNERSAAVLDRYAEASPDSIGSRFLNALYGARDLEPDQTIDAFARAVNLNPQTGEWTRETQFEDPELVRIVVRTFDMARRGDLAMRVLEAAAEDPASEFGIALVRRLYWSGSNDRVLARAQQVPEGVAAADLNGYAAMIALNRGDATLLDELRAKLEAFDYDYRSQGWLHAIAAARSLRDGEIVEARTKITEAIDRYTLEPTFRLLIGDVQDRSGRLSDALEAWSIAEELAEPFVWIEPGTRAVAALLRAGRLVEAGDAALRMVDRSRSSLPAVVLLVQTDAVLARAGVLDPARAARSLNAAKLIRDEVLADKRPEFSLIIASLEGAVGNTEAARAELSLLLDGTQTPETVADAIAIDQAFGLGFADQLGPMTLPDRVDDPSAALRSALNHVNGPADGQEVRVSEALAMIDAGLKGSSAADRAAWLRTNAVFRDAVRADGAAAAWRSAIDADPANLSLRMEAIESNALGYDAEFVQRNIDQIVEMTASQGRTLPSRLRLARAKSVFGREPTRQRRDEAISIVRAVVVAEPQNIAARTMLANMLQFPCPPTVSGADRFTPDLAGAVEQYVAVARLIPGSEAYAYLFKAADLQITAGNEAPARQMLLDIFSRAQGDVASQQRVALEVSRLGDAQTAARLLGELYASSQGPTRVALGLQLAQVAIASNDRARAESVLRDIMSAPSMSSAQLVDLSQWLRKIGLPAEADRVLANAENYGVAGREALLARARAAAGSGDADSAVLMLIEAAEQSVEDPEIWQALVRILVDQGKFQEASDRADQALALFPENDELRYWKQIALNDPAAAIRIMTARPETDEALKLAIERVESYDRRRESLNRAQRLAELKELSATFPDQPAVVKFSLRERIELADDASELADATIAASRRFVGDEDLLRMASDATFQAGRFADSIRIATDWRGRTRGSPLQPDLYAAQAEQALDDHAAALSRMQPYLESALRAPDESFNAMVLFLHGRSALRTQSEPAVRARLEPVARRSERFRSTVWLELAAIHVPQASAAADWLRSAEQMGVPGSEIALAEAWMVLAQRFPDRAADFAFNAVRITGSAMEGQVETTRLITTAARAHLLWADALTGEKAIETYSLAETMFVRAAQLEPGNPNYRFQAAAAASRANRPYEAERYYREVVEDPATPSDLLAAARNNLAGLLSLVNPNQQRLQEALSLADQAVAFGPVPAFHGTRGWVLLGLGRTADAASEFQEVARLDGNSVEAWAGLAVVRAASGAPPEQVAEALGKARELAAVSGPISSELRARLDAAGVRWESDNE